MSVVVSLPLRNIASAQLMRKSLREPKFKEGSTNTDLQNPYQPIQILVFQLFPIIVELNPRLGLAEIHEEVPSNPRQVPSRALMK